MDTMIESPAPLAETSQASTRAKALQEKYGFRKRYQIMDALKRLEQSGFKFGLEGPKVMFVLEPGDGGAPMSERPRVVQEVVYERYADDLAEVRAHADEVRAIVQARSEWEATYDERAAAGV